MSLKDTYSSAWEALPVTLTAGSTLSGSINLGGLRFFGIVMPVDWTPANLTFQTSPDAGATWFDMLDQNGNELLVASAPGTYIALNTPFQFASMPYLKIRSGTSALPVAQASDRVLQLFLRSI